MNAQAMQPSAWNSRRWLILLAALLSMAITASLGAWQMRRAAYKEQLQEQIWKQNQLLPGNNAALSAIKSIVNEDAIWLHRNVILRGQWLHEHTVFLDNRPMTVGSQKRVGFFVATPFLLEESNKVVWVQRGWVARDFQDRAKLPELPVAAGSVEIQGRIMAQISRAFEMGSGEVNSVNASKDAPAAARASRIWQNLPEINFSPRVLLPVAVLQTGSAQPDALLRDWPAADTGVAKHHGYAFQWFALSALILVLYVWFQLIAPRRQSR